MIRKAVKFFLLMLVPTAALMYATNPSGGLEALIHPGAVAAVRLYLVASVLIVLIQNLLERLMFRKGLDLRIWKEGVAGFGLLVLALYLGLSLWNGSDLTPLSVLSSAALYGVVGWFYGRYRVRAAEAAESAKTEKKGKKKKGSAQGAGKKPGRKQS